MTWISFFWIAATIFPLLLIYLHWLTNKIINVKQTFYDPASGTEYFSCRWGHGCSIFVKLLIFHVVFSVIVYVSILDMVPSDAVSDIIKIISNNIFIIAFVVFVLARNPGRKVYRIEPEGIYRWRFAMFGTPRKIVDFNLVSWFEPMADGGYFHSRLDEPEWHESYGAIKARGTWIPWGDSRGVIIRYIGELGVPDSPPVNTQEYQD